MSRVLVIGGYGGFGGHLARRLAQSGNEVIVAGRSKAKAEAFCRRAPGCRPLRADRQSGLSQILAAERPDIVVDASGPFQLSDYRLVEDCIGAGLSYVDLADAHQFVTGIGRFDQLAQKAAVVVISGASSVPALSGAVVRKLAEGVERSTSVEIAISASSRASVGPSVAAAILGGVGRPIELWRGQRWTTGHGWQELRREQIVAGSQSVLRNRLVALADVPDLALLPGRLRGRPAVTFRAGTESKLAVLILWLASWAVRSGWMRSLTPFKRILIRAHRLTALWGGDRSGMSVRLFGFSGKGRIERRWSLVADAGDGPQIPTLAAAILVDKVMKGQIPPGARDAGELLQLEDFEPSFRALAVTHEIAESEQPPSLYRRIMGKDFDRLAPSVQAMHDVLRDSGASGRAHVERGSHWVAKIVARAMRFPKSGECAVHVHFAERNGTERWTRDFGEHCFSSALSQSGDDLVERFGPLRFRFALAADGGGLSMQITRWSLFGIPLPLALAPKSPAREWEEGGFFQFDVPIELPFVGPVVRYRGWLQQPLDVATANQNGTSSSRLVSNAAGCGRDLGLSPPPPLE